MLKLPHHPNAFLSLKRNIKPGLSARTQIISALEMGTSTTRKISQQTGLSYKVVLYHLHLLEANMIVSHKDRRRYVWELSGSGQQRLPE
jgi:predicted transcriptional regulator